MPSKIATLFGLSLDEEKDLKATTSKVTSLAEWLGETVEAVKDTPLLRLLGDVGEAAKEWSGTVKALSKLLDKVSKENDPGVLGWLACSLAYREAAETAIRRFGPPRSHLPFSGQVAHDGLQRLPLEDPGIMTGFALSNAAGHPFVRAADQALLLVLKAAGYEQDEQRRITREVRSSFPGKVQELLSGEHKEKFAAFAVWLQLDADDSRLYATLVSHAEGQRHELEDRPALGVEPFSVDQVYIECECGILPWKTIRDENVDQFGENSAPRVDLMEAVRGLIIDSSYNDCIAIYGAPGAGKSTFTKKLCVVLNDEGFVPIRIPLQHLRVDMELFSAIQDVVTRFGGPSARPFKPELLREKVFSEAVPTAGRNISPYVFILDAWDEINLSADEGFQQRVDHLLTTIRNTLLDQTRNTVRVVITGRPSKAIARTNFLRDQTLVLTLRPLRPAHLSAYMESLARALDSPKFSGPEIETWALGDLDRYAAVLSAYEKEFPEVHQLEVLGQPLLAYLALKVMASFKGNLKGLISPPTTLYRHLTDLTCARAGKAPTATGDFGKSAQVQGSDLRSLLHGTALGITAYGSESIPLDELECRFETLGVGEEVFRQSREHSISNLMLSFFFKEVKEQSGCEFLHKSFREYLAAEAIVEILKEYARMAPEALPEREVFWQEFRPDDVRYWLTRKLGEIFCAQWTSDEIIAHVRELLRWELSRETLIETPPASARPTGILTQPITLVQWERARDGLADLWDWWGEGVHLRPQPKPKQREWRVDEVPFVVDLLKLAMRRVNYGHSKPPRPIRTATVDAHLGYALFQLNCFLHGLIAEVQGWMKLANDVGPAQLWKDSAPRRRCQVLVPVDGNGFVQFRPSGLSSDYFRNYALRINGAGVAPRDFMGAEFPTRLYMHGICLSNCYLSRIDFSNADLQTATMRDSALDGTILLEADLRLALMTDIYLRGADLRGAELGGADLTGTSLSETTLSELELPDVAGPNPERPAETDERTKANTASET